MWKRSILSPAHVIRDFCDGNAEAGWIPVGQPYPSGHGAPLFHPNCRCIQEVKDAPWGVNPPATM